MYYSYFGKADDYTCWGVQIYDVGCLAPCIWIVFEHHAAILTVLTVLCKIDLEWSMLVYEACTLNTVWFWKLTLNGPCIVYEACTLNTVWFWQLEIEWF